MSSLIEKYLLATLAVQFVLSLVNSLFSLSDINATIALLGFYGVDQHHKPSLWAYILFAAISLAVDAIRLGSWASYITGHLLGTIGSLGTYYLVLTCFGGLVKIIACIFTYLLIRRIVRIEKEPLLLSPDTIEDSM